jgi:hypothetical protein
LVRLTLERLTELADGGGTGVGIGIGIGIGVGVGVGVGIYDGTVEEDC